MNMPSGSNDLRCPVCGGHMLEGRKSLFCENWRDGCGVRVWKESFGHKFSTEELGVLLAGKELGPLDLVSRAGRSFRATLRLDAADGKLRLIFADRKAAQPFCDDGTQPESA